MRPMKKKVENPVTDDRMYIQQGQLIKQLVACSRMMVLNAELKSMNGIMA